MDGRPRPSPVGLLGVSSSRRLLGASAPHTYNPIRFGGQVAQLVEQRTENPRVGSSILPLATSNTSTRAPDRPRSGRRGSGAGGEVAEAVVEGMTTSRLET